MIEPLPRSQSELQSEWLLEQRRDVGLLALLRRAIPTRAAVSRAPRGVREAERAPATLRRVP